MVGRAATHVVGDPTVEELHQYSEDRDRPLLGGPEIHHVRMEVRIDGETDLPLSTRLGFEVAEGDRSATARTETRFSGYDGPVSIVVPEEAFEHQL